MVATLPPRERRRPPRLAAVRQLLVLACAAVLAAPGAAAAAPPSIVKAPIRTVHAGQGTIGYRDVGHGRPLILIMGLSGTMDSWERLTGGDPSGRPLKRLRLPVLVGGGALDVLLPVADQRRLAAALPHARLRIYPQAAHGFLFQERTAFLAQIERFLR